MNVILHLTSNENKELIMFLKPNPILSKIRKRTNIGIKKNDITQFRKKIIFFKSRKINIEINSFHLDIVNKYKSINKMFFNQDLQFLHFIAPIPEPLAPNKTVEYIVKERVNEVLEKVYIEQKILETQFRLKELALQRANLMQFENNNNDIEAIKQTVVKELKEFRNIPVDDLDDRIIFYTNLNTYLEESKIVSKNIDFTINEKSIFKYKSKEIKKFINNFKEIEIIKNKNQTTKVKLIEKKILKDLDIKEVKRSKKTKILKNNTYENIVNISTLFKNGNKAQTQDFDRIIKQSSVTLKQVLQNKELNQVSDLDNKKVITEISKTIDSQVKILFNNIVISEDVKYSFEENINYLFSNKELSSEDIKQELDIIKNSYVNNILHHQDNVISTNNIKNKVYKQCITNLSKSKVIVNFDDKKVLLKKIDTVLSRKDDIQTIFQYNEVISEVLKEYSFESNSFKNDDTVGKLGSILFQKHKLENIKQKEGLNKNYIKNNAIELHLQQITNKQVLNVQNSINKITKENRVDNIYNNIIQEIKHHRPFVQLSVLDKKTVLQKVDKLVKLQNPQTIQKEYVKIKNEYINNAINQDISTQLNQTVVNKMTQENRVDNIYNNIIQEIKQHRPFVQLSVLDKKTVLQKVDKLTKLQNPQTIQKEYMKIKNEYINNTINNSITQDITTQLNQTIVNKMTQENKVDNIYNNIIQEIKYHRPFVQLSVLDKKVVLQKVDKLVKIQNPQTIQKEYMKIKNEYINNSINQDISTQLNQTIVNKMTQENKVDNIYNNIIQEIKHHRPFVQLSVLDKKTVLQKVDKLTKLQNPQTIQKEYMKIKNEYINNSINQDISTQLNQTIVNKMTQENKVDNIYNNIIQEIKHHRPFVQLSVLDKKVVLQKVDKLVKIQNPQTIQKEYMKIKNQYINNPINNSINNSINQDITTQLNQTVVNKMTQENKVDNIYNNIIQEIKQHRPFVPLSVLDKKVVLKKVNKLIKIQNPQTIQKEYMKIKNEYINNSINNVINQDITTQLNQTVVNKMTQENRVDNVYNNIIQEIKQHRPFVQLSVLDKKVVLKKVNKLIKIQNPQTIQKEYMKIKNEYINNSINQDIAIQTKKDISSEMFSNKLMYINSDEPLNTYNKNVLLRNVSRNNNLDEDKQMVYVGNPTAIAKTQEKRIEACNKSIDLEIKQKKYEVINSVQNIYESFDENLDELALKIFNDIKDEINIDYKRI